MKIAVVNRTNLKNYGSLLQSFALCEVVCRLGYDSEIIWESGSLYKNYDLRINKIISTLCKLIFHPKLIRSTFGDVKTVQEHVISENTVSLFDKFIDEHITRKFYRHFQMNKRNVGKKYDKFICGSDQVWCTTTLYVDPLMYLRFAPKEKRIAYAPSLGRDYIPRYNQRKIKRYISDIPYVSVREVKGQELIRQLTGVNVPVLLDPTLLLSAENWDRLKTAPKMDQPYILCYFLSTPRQETQRKLCEFAKAHGKTVVALNAKLEDVEKECTVIYPDCGPSEFIGFVSEADFVLTDSYHGMLFSILYHKSFWSIAREYGEYDQSSRQRSVLDMLGLTERYVGASDSIEEGTIDYGTVDDVLRDRRNYSVAYLKTAMEDDG